MMHSVFSDLKENDSEEFEQLRMLTDRRTACNCPFCIQGGIRDEVGIKLHICLYENCVRTFRKTSHLKVHLRSHSGEKPFKCEWVQVPSGKPCQREFTRSDELKRHMRTHTDDKQFHCTFCEKRFMRSDHLHKHLKTHTKESRVKTCPHCPRKFLRTDNLEMHILVCKKEQMKTKPLVISSKRPPQQNKSLVISSKRPPQQTKPQVISPEKSPQHPTQKAVTLAQEEIDTEVQEIDIKRHFMLQHFLVPLTNVDPRKTSDLLEEFQCTSSSNSDDSGNEEQSLQQESPPVVADPSSTEDGYLEEPE